MIMGGFVISAYIGASVLFILSLGGLSNQETARRGNVYGIAGMAIAILATLASDQVSGIGWIILAMVIGGAIGVYFAVKVQMTQMPELVAMMHSFVGLAAVMVGYASFLDPELTLIGAEKTVHDVEVYLGILIGAATFSGSLIAFGKLRGIVASKPLLLPGRHWMNLSALVLCILFGSSFVGGGGSDLQVMTGTAQHSIWPLILMTLVALAFGVHMVMAIGGADMPVVVSMLNSYSGWAAAAAGFMLSNDLLIVVGALVGSSGAILSYIMCRAMNRKFVNVILGGFGTTTSTSSAGQEEQGETTSTTVEDVADLLNNANSVVIVPGYGMAVSHAQHPVSEITQALRNKGVNVRFAIHPVAGRMPGHMNVLLAEAKVPYDLVLEMDEINDDLPETDVVLVIGANDTVNPSAAEDPGSPIAGMPVIEVWKATTVVVFKRSMATGYSGVENPLFFKDNTRMLFGDARDSVDGIFKNL
ncbi:MAG: Re/Si-specific NAD(P)(+) transhydrogenase subunit beta [Motiliproteus sp.]